MPHIFSRIGGCQQAAPYCAAARILVQEAGFCGGLHRSDPTGGAAYGIPLYAPTPLVVIPAIRPASIVTVDSSPNAEIDKATKAIVSRIPYDTGVGRTLIVLGLLIAAAGVLITLGDKLPIKPGRLPGDIVIRGKNSTFYFPLVTSLLLSILLSLVMWLLNRR
jgi:hypothetical protein